MIKPDAYMNMGKIVDAIYTSGFKINKIKMAKFTIGQAKEFYAEHAGKPFFNGLISYITSDVVVGMELVANNAVAKWRELIGPTNVEKAKAEAPNSLRALYGKGETNAVHGSDSNINALREINFFFSNNITTVAALNNCSCLLIKPHVVLAGQSGKIIDTILQQGFEISGLEMFTLDKFSSEEFFEVYKAVLPEFVPMVEHISSGPLIALELRQEGVVPKLRELVGPNDPEIAKHLRPNSLRAKYGLDRVRNGFHCTDLEEDGALESEYFFSLLQQKKVEEVKK
jgi:nucleoside-diphosphate kinase